MLGIQDKFCVERELQKLLFLWFIIMTMPTFKFMGKEFKKRHLSHQVFFEKIEGSRVSRPENVVDLDWI